MCHNLQKCQKVKNNPMDHSSTCLASANLSPRTVNAREKSLGRNLEVTKMQVEEAHPQAGVGLEGVGGGRQLRAGTVWINTHSMFDAALPIGGVKQSGYGRDSGITALDNYLETKTVCAVV